MATTMTNPPGNAIAERKQQQIAQVVGELRDEGFREQLRELLPATIPVERFAQITLTALMDDMVKQPEAKYQLINADRASLFQAVVRCAQDGLLPNGKQAALVVFAGKVQYMPMVDGLRAIVAEYGWTLRGQAVREQDAFEYEEEPPWIKFRHARPGVERGGLVYAYAVARHKDGRREQKVMTREDVLKRQAVAKTQKVWSAWPDEMWAKTPEKDLAQDLPLDPAEKERLNRVLSAIDHDPVESARSLYGPTGSLALEASPTSAPPQGPDGTGDGQQASDARSPHAAASEAPGITTVQPDAPEAAKQGYNPPVGVTIDPVVVAADEAGKLVPPVGQHAAAGRTLHDILALGTNGVRWFDKACCETPDLPVAFVDGLAAFTRVYLPEIHEKAGYTAEVEL